MSVRKRILPSGEIRWLVDYKDQTGARRARQFATQREAKAWEATAKVEVVARTHVPTSQAVTVREAIENYLKHCEARVGAGEMERRSLADVKSKLAHVTGENGIPEVLLPDVSFTVADAMRLRLVAAGVSGANAGKIAGTLRTMLNWAKDTRLIGQNPLSGRKMKRGSREKVQVSIPSQEQISKLLEAADNLPGSYPRYIRAAVLTGCRAGELRGLQWRHVDFAAGTISVEQRAEQDGSIGQPKTASGHRRVPVPVGLLAKLKEAFLASGRDLDRFVFTDPPRKPAKPKKGEAPKSAPLPANEPLDHDNFGNRWWRPMLKRQGLESLDFHHLRHYYASALLNAGVPVTEVSRRLGHADPSITLKIYSHALPEASSGAELAGIEAGLTSKV
ncbi:site-specific integrase [Magnetospirillum fulvum]|uniref:Phage integrase n=1 Tax=Magnetospirillum fulvum MGU-K5 TaxID=1316936 RepID=S9TEI6_MAGFU|nr:site-specific integrase [Magnetospirillum fulvum]EPY00621.1 phage integrase [Magnetospirillum fulvum MGU-K5]